MRLPWYVRYIINSLDRKGIETIGFYNKGKKDGNWFYFSSGGYLSKEGNFSNDQKTGLWTEYYRVIPKDSNTLVRLNSAFEVNKGIQMTHDGQILIDRSKLIKSSKGVYINDVKIGAWNYYNFEDSLVHKFNHSASQMISEKYNYPADSICPYLGGCSRFFKKYEEKSFFASKEATKFTLEIHPDSQGISITTLNLSGDYQMAEVVKKVLTEIDNDFIFQNADQPILFNIENEGYTGGMFSKTSISFGKKNANN